MTKKTRSRKKLRYPDKTQGSEVAAQIREEANQMTDAEREASFHLGMQIIYGAGPDAKKATRTGH